MSIEEEIIIDSLNLYIEKIEDKLDRIDINKHGTTGHNRLSNLIFEANVIRSNILKYKHSNQSN